MRLYIFESLFCLRRGILLLQVLFMLLGGNQAITTTWVATYRARFPGIIFWLRKWFFIVWRGLTWKRLGWLSVYLKMRFRAFTSLGFLFTGRDVRRVLYITFTFLFFLRRPLIWSNYKHVFCVYLCVLYLHRVYIIEMLVLSLDIKGPVNNIWF